jgi:hypothetical protein
MKEWQQAHKEHLSAYRKEYKEKKKGEQQWYGYYLEYYY